ncbi:MAG TPA: S8 family serine peptidase, partial [Thermoanaerobaculia bacterium]|nr:S8 family serine peptidase [Thermoanaerobaculia bacterium]
IPSGDSKARPTQPEDLKIGDVVIIPEVPLWTHVVVNPKIVADRAALVSALATKLKCRTEEPEACLAERDVTVLDRATTRQPNDPEPASIQYFRENILREEAHFRDDLQTVAEGIVMETLPTAAAASAAVAPAPSLLPPPASPLPAPLSGTVPLSISLAPERWPHDIGLLATTRGGEDRNEDPGLCSTEQSPILTWIPELLSQANHGLQAAVEVTAIEVVMEVSSTAVADSDAAAPILRPLPSPPSAPLGPTPASVTTPVSIPVAPEQWPYDIGLIAVILKDAVDAEYIRTSTTIGVADGGLGNLSGNPLPESLFDIGIEKLTDDLQSEPDGEDNDDNRYVDDIFGAGVARVRGGGDLGTGDLGLCETDQPPFATWNPDRLERFSHGAVTSSVAAALGLRKIAPQVTGALPKLVFFRMLESACTEDAGDKPEAAEMVLAFDYLERRSHIINISYIMDRDETGLGFAGYIRSVLPYRDVLLVLPAGNNWPGDLDEHGTCPPCLGNDLTDRGGPAAKRTIVVGAATRNLHRATYSNYGERTVGLFAPGEPMGALDLANQQVPLTKSATSYAAPLVALAAGIVRSFGTNNPKDIKDRLIATTWPLNDPDSRPDRTHVGVLDLVKAAAVRHHAVEVKEAEPDGQLVRRTYVGKLLTPLRELEFFCDGPTFSEARVHAIRLGEPVDDGERQLLVYYRERMDNRTNRRLIQSFSCRPEGELRIRTLMHGEKTFPLSEVTQIQLPWLLQ